MPDPSETPERMIAPVPRITIQAFCETPETAATVEGAGADRRLQKAHLKVQMGGAAAAVAATTVYTLAAEDAAADSAGPGSFAVALLDRLHAVTPEGIAARAELVREEVAR